MRWPTPQDYNEAVQNPRLAFTDPDLRLGQPELTRLGLPRPICGNFACVYNIRSNGQRWAARCFMNDVPDLQHRYSAISQCLTKANLPYTVPFTYLSGGIKLQGRSYPLVKMQWVQGEPLNVFVGRTIWYPQTLLSLAKGWLQVITALRALNIAHGDLQHGNILVTGGGLHLIDYDGMFVPALAGDQSNELGHRNYQLPSRSGHDYGPYLDNFSAWVVYVSLVALAVHPELWSTYDGGDECLIFRKEDFKNPKKSAILRYLKSSPNDQLRVLIDLFVSLFVLSPRDVPSPNGSLPQITVTPRKPWWDGFPKTPPPRVQPTSTAPRYPVRTSQNRNSGLWRIGVVVAVILLVTLSTLLDRPNSSMTPDRPVPAPTSPSPSMPTPTSPSSDALSADTATTKEWVDGAAKRAEEWGKQPDLTANAAAPSHGTSLAGPTYLPTVRKALPVEPTAAPSTTPLVATYRVVNDLPGGILNLHEGPSSASRVRVEIRAGTGGIKIGESRRNGPTLWRKISVGPYTGWVNEIYLEASTPRQEINESPANRLSQYDWLSRESAARRLRDLGVNANPNSESFLAMSDKESRVRAARRLHDLGYDVDWRRSSFLEMSDIESRIRASKRLQDLNYSVDWRSASFLSMSDIESRIRAARRLESLGIVVDWRIYSFLQLSDMESKARQRRSTR